MPEHSLYFSALLAGLLGASHCIGMCGGIVTALTLGASTKTAPPLLYLFVYNSGRILSYTFAGFLMGAIGSTLSYYLLPLHQVQFVLGLVAGIFMILLGLYLGRWWHGFKKIEHLGGQLWQLIEPLSKRFIPVSSLPQAFILGMLWGYLPCGLVYTMLFWSISTGNASQGALIMFSFALGTLPLLLTMGIFACQLRQLMQKDWLYQITGILVIALGIVHLFTLFTA